MGSAQKMVNSRVKKPGEAFSPKKPRFYLNCHSEQENGLVLVFKV